MLLIAGLLACARPQSAPPEPLVAPYRWMVGTWTDAYVAESVSTEAWWDGGEALHGVSVTVEGGRTTHFEVMAIEVEAGRLRLRANPDAQAEVVFPLVSEGVASLRFENPAHDYPTTVEYVRAKAGLHAGINGPGGADPYAWDFVPVPAETAPALEAADRAFAAAAQQTQAEAWSEVWHDDGQLVRGGRLVGPTAVAASMSASYAAGLDLRWEPRSSGLSPAGDLGYTAGTWSASVKRKASGRGSYVTVWRKDADGAWRVAFHDRSTAP